MESQIFMDNGKDNFETKKNKNKSVSPFSDLPGMRLKGSIMPFGNISEEEELDSKNELSNKEEVNDDFNFGGAYMGDDDGFEKEPKKEEKNNNNKSKIKKSSILGMSLNNNVFEFNNQYDENYVGELKMEINDLYKKRDKMEDELNDKDEQLKKSMINIDQLNKIIEQKNKEIEELKKK